MATATSTTMTSSVACAFSSRLVLLLSLICFVSLPVLCSCDQPVPLPAVHLGEPVLDFTMSPDAGNSCRRVQITGISRLNLKNYSNVVHITLNVSGTMPERLNGKLQVCSHRNASLGACQCEEDKWVYLQQGKWNSIVSPFESRYFDIKLQGRTSVSFRISIDEEFQPWRLVSLGLGIFLLFMAPIISNWVPFYYSSTMILGVLSVAVLILFQVMKLLPMCRRNTIYLAFYGSLLGVCSFIIHYISMVVSSVLVSFGLGEEMHNLVLVSLAVLIILVGAALGCYIVRRFILSEVGGVNAGVAQFVKCVIRFFAMAFIFQSTHDSILGLTALAISWSFCYLVT